jgi:hypothetical protein
MTTASETPTDTGLCGVGNPDYPGKYACSYPLGHGPVTAEDDDSMTHDHGVPELGCWWSTVSSADEISAPQPALSAGDIRVDTVRRVRAIILPFLDTAERWRYDRVAWAFAIMLGEIPEDTPEPVIPIPSLSVLLGHFHAPSPSDPEAGN